MFFEDGMVKYEMKIGDFSITNCESLTIFTTFYYNTNIHTYIHTLPLTDNWFSCVRLDLMNEQRILTVPHL